MQHNNIFDFYPCAELAENWIVRLILILMQLNEKVGLVTIIIVNQTSVSQVLLCQLFVVTTN